MSKQIGTFSVNGHVYERIIEPHMLLVDVLRDELGLTGTKRACGSGSCGACTVLMNGKPRASCLTLAIRATDQPLQTVEGLAEDQQLHPLQQAFVDNLGAQCGYCTAGMMLSAKVLIDANPDPSRDEVIHALGGNLCRCTGYVKIIESVLDAARRMRKGGS